jgi:DNA polymerase
VVILGCGYGLGWRGLREQAAGYGLYLSDDEAATYVNAYRTRYPLVPALWYRGRDAAVLAVQNPGREFTYKRNTFRCIRDRNSNSWLQLTLPSGRALYYNEPKLAEGAYGPELSAMGINPYSHKWQRLRIIPGRITENIIQALARDILVNGKIKCDEAGHKIIASIHDEIVFEVPDRGENNVDQLRELRDCMCDLPSWAEGLPLRADGFIAKRFRKE